MARLSKACKTGNSVVASSSVNVFSLAIVSLRSQLLRLRAL
jgi:hypothetical protein